MRTDLHRVIEPRTWLAVPIGVVMMLFLGALFSLVTEIHHWGIVSFVLFLAWLFLLAFVQIYLSRFARLHRAHIALVFGFLLLLAYLVGEITGMMFMRRLSVAQWYQDRWINGFALFGAGSYAISGLLWAVVHVVRMLLLIFVVAGAPYTEAFRQFCRECRTSSTRTRWKTIVGPFDPPSHNSIKNCADLVSLSPVDQSKWGIWVRIRTCRCGNLGELRADLYDRQKSTAGATLIDDAPISPVGIVRLVDWVHRVDSSAVLPDAHFDIMQLGAHRQPFDRAVQPDGPEWKSLLRWGGATSGLEWYCDNEYTRELRRRVRRDGHLVIEDSLAVISDINDRACVYDAVADWPDSQDWIEYWHKEQPESSEMWTVRGLHLVRRAWVKRGSGWVPKNYPVFQGLLEDAMLSLDNATRLDKDNAIAHAWKIYAGKGLGRDLDEVAGFFTQATKNHPDLHAAHWMMFDYLTPKWHGSKEQCLSFARRALDRCDLGSPVASMIAFAHLEIAFQLSGSAGPGIQAYLQQSDARAEIVRANAKVFTRHRMSMVTPRVRALFAYALWKCGEFDLARPHLEIIGTSTLWGPFEPAIPFRSQESVRAARRACRM